MLVQMIDGNLRGRNFFDGDINYNALRNFDGSAHLGHRCVHPHPDCAAARLQFYSANLHLVLHHLAGSPHRRRILMVGDCMGNLHHKLGIVGAGCDVEEYRTILRSRPHITPPQGKLQRLADSWQCVDAIPNQLTLIPSPVFTSTEIADSYTAGRNRLNGPNRLRTLVTNLNAPTVGIRSN